MISVIIPAYNEEKTIGQTLKSLEDQDYKGQFEVVLVDNNSTDGTAKIAKKFSKSLPLRIVLEKKQGRGAAKARGAEESKGEILAYLDADTIATKNWLSVIEKSFTSEKVVAITGPWRVHDLKDGSTKWILHSMQEAAQLPYRIPFGHFWLNGMNMAIRKEAYEKCGGINPELNIHDDVDISTRLGKVGKIKYIEDMKVMTSGRRYKKGLVAGLATYHKSTLSFLQKKRADLEDIR